LELNLCAHFLDLRLTATGRVQEAGGVGRKASLSNSRIPNASGVADEGISTNRRKKQQATIAQQQKDSQSTAAGKMSSA